MVIFVMMLVSGDDGGDDAADDNGVYTGNGTGSIVMVMTITFI